MRRTWRLWIPLLLAACGQQSTTPAVLEEDLQLEADQVGEGVQTRITNNGVVTALLVSDTTYFHESQRRADLRGVQATFFTETGAPTGTVTSRTGDYDTANGLFIARGNVVLITEGPNGERRLETEELHYDKRSDQIWTNSPFTLLEAGRVTSGSSFRTDSKFSTWEVVGVQTQGTVSGDGGIRF